MAAVAELVRRVANDYVEVHVAAEKLRDLLFCVVGVDEGVGVRLLRVASVERVLARSAVRAAPAFPRVLGPLEPDVAAAVVERIGDGVLAVGVLRAVHAPAGQQPGEVGDADAEDLLRQDVRHALL